MGRSDIVYERMRAALGHLHHDPHVHELAPGPGPGREFVLQGTHLRDVLLRAFAPGAEADSAPGERGGAFRADMRVQSWARRYARARPVRVEGDPVLAGLNATQVRAVAMMVGERISLVQGVSFGLYAQGLVKGLNAMLRNSRRVQARPRRSSRRSSCSR